MIHIYRLRIKKIIEETQDAKSFILENLDKKTLHYHAGQFLTLLFEQTNGTEVRRSYSISSSPVLDKELAITVKKIANGEFSRRLADKAKVGDILMSIGASGLFTLPTTIKSNDRFCFMAAGSGITPIFSLIKTLLHNNPTTSILLIYSNTSQSSTIFFNQLTELRESFQNRFAIEFLFSHSTKIFESRLTHSVIDLLIDRYALYEHNNTIFYLCGPYAYMRMVSIKLRADGIDAERIKKELFIIDTPSFKLVEPPDQEAHEVTIFLNKQRYSIEVKYPTSILQSAKKRQIPIPYSCENGQCGACAALCTKGKVWMRYNEVLGNKALAEGYILTCTGYPIDGPVELTL
ncbi:ferredoxin--NADP reductase [Olivibacter domesticus]|uniref:Ring-1,2-phenylacetyl-CoA epoxidase subunit PaaE n=1 Tax=Olivibacter domesticus TaxID=407022 RepID=A0A1H7M8M3_OLID1|nr:ferredoxin--NADP reductase [Olivibacter domesticus]SEL07278.1 ring-1,2-phenylacetyl-CoA epoxidase subunit PaaE [Olivibacter domesticus]